jgi:hypothetical protein
LLSNEMLEKQTRLFGELIAVIFGPNQGGARRADG